MLQSGTIKGKGYHRSGVSRQLSGIFEHFTGFHLTMGGQDARHLALVRRTKMFQDLTEQAVLQARTEAETGLVRSLI